MAELDDFHSTHPAPPRPDALPVSWSSPLPHSSGIRVRDYTCECRSLVFELCVAGGLAFIRRYDRSVSPGVIVESPRERAHNTELLWWQLIAGKAR